MAKIPARRGEAQKEFAKVLLSVCDRHSSWQVWSDFVFMSAAAISNALDTSDKAVHREEQYKQTISQYSKEEQQIFPQLLTMIVNELEIRPDQDFLGEMFMDLELSNHWKGQFFTPYNVCRMMAEMILGNPEAKIKNQGYVGINDPACGAGALLVAARNVLMRRDVDWSTQALFVAQDIDRTAGLMCYIQLSLLGCAGYVVIGDTLSNPVVGPDELIPIEKEGQDIWFTPVFYHNIWQGRRAWKSASLFLEQASEGAGSALKPETIVEHKEAPKPPAMAFATTENGQLTLF